MKDILKELKKDLEKKTFIGTDSVIKNLKKRNLKKVYISSNCPQDIKEDIEEYKKLSDVEIIQLNYPNDELGHLSKKSYHISVLGIAKENQI